MCLSKQEREVQDRMNEEAKRILAIPRVVSNPTPESLERHRLEATKLRKMQEENYANNPSCVARKNWWENK